MRRLALVATALATVLSVTGCSDYKGINSLNLPGTVGTDSDSYQVTMKLQNAVNQVPNTPVLIDDIIVGTVTKVTLDGWTPVLTLSLRNDVKLPANTTASLGQTSLLGSKHIALSAPPGDAAQGVLQPGAVIPEDRTKRYPETEEVLAGVSLLLNGGGLQHFQTITTELNKALGNGGDVQTREFLTQLNNFVGGLDKQKGDIVNTMVSLDKLGSTLAPRIDEIATALQQLPPGLKVLNDQEPALMDTIGKLSKASDLFTELHGDGIKDLKHIVEELDPVLRHIGDTKDESVLQTLKIAPFAIFPLDSIPYAFRGDFVHIILTLDLTNEALDQAFLTGTPLAGSAAALTKLQREGVPKLPGLQAGNPLSLPLGGPVAPAAPPAPSSKPGGGLLNKPLPGIGG